MASIADRTSEMTAVCSFATAASFQMSVPDICGVFMYLWLVNFGPVELLCQCMQVAYLCYQPVLRPADYYYYYYYYNFACFLYGCETWSLILREERNLRVFENMVLRRIFGPRRDEMTGEWRRLHNEELNDLYSSPNIVRVIKSRIMRLAGHGARMGEERGAYRVLVGKPKGKRPLGRPRRRWVDNIRMDLQEVGCGYVDWIGLAQDTDRWRTLVNAVMNLRVP
jgi:hypothetical protein